ncbi:MAG TPA: biotin transporter BioY [Pseudolysinimonas sp.]|nr:biotin transporter BioY [Pseudolysinimonas sp.]
MTTVDSSSGLVLADRVFPRHLAVDVALVFSGTALVALFAQIAIPLNPVPITGQTLAVLLVGASLGWARGVMALGLYAAAGIAGLPVFSPNADGSHSVGFSVITGPKGGYIIGFILSVALVGWLSERQWDRKIFKALATCAGGTVVTFLVGVSWLYAVLKAAGPSMWRDELHYDSVFAATMGAGLLPFLLGGVVKAAIAAVLLPLAWMGANRLKERE